VGNGSHCIGLTTLPPSCANCLEIWEPQPSGTLRACPDLYRDCFTFYLYHCLAWIIHHLGYLSFKSVLHDLPAGHRLYVAIGISFSELCLSQMAAKYLLL